MIKMSVAAIAIFALASFAARPQDLSRVEFRVNVTDKQGRSVTRLKAENFRVRENGVEQRVLSARIDYAPVSVAILIDVSASVKQARRQTLIQTVGEFISEANPSNEYSILAFGRRFYPLTDWGTPRETMNAKLLELGTQNFDGEYTRLYDALAVGAEKLASGSHSRGAIIVFSDGDDDSTSKISWKKTKEIIELSDAFVYCVSITDSDYPGSFGKKLGAIGGAFFFGRDSDSLDVASRIADYLESQYIIEWETAFLPEDTKWHEIDIDAFDSDANGNKTNHRVTARKGYFPSAVRIGE